MNYPITAIPGRANVERFPFEPVSYVEEILAWGRQPTSKVIQNGWIMPDRFRIEPLSFSGTVDWAADEFEITAEVEPANMRDRHISERDTTPAVYNLTGATTLRAYPYRIEGTKDNGAYVAASMFQTNTMGAASRNEFYMNLARAQMKEIGVKYDPITFQAWFQSQTVLKTGQESAQVEGFEDGVTSYTVQTDLSANNTDSKQDIANDFKQEISTVITALKQKGTNYGNSYQIAVPHSVLDILKAADAFNYRYIDPRDYRGFDRAQSDVYNANGLMFMGVHNDALGTFDTPEAGVYGYLNNRSVLGAQARVVPMDGMFSVVGNQGQAMLNAVIAEFNAAMAGQDLQGRAIMESWLNGVGKAYDNPGQGTVMVQGNMFYIQTFSLAPNTPDAEAMLLSSEYTGIRLRGDQMVVLQFLNSKLPAPAVLTYDLEDTRGNLMRRGNIRKMYRARKNPAKSGMGRYVIDRDININSYAPVDGVNPKEFSSTRKMIPARSDGYLNVFNKLVDKFKVSSLSDDEIVEKLHTLVTGNVQSEEAPAAEAPAKNEAKVEDKKKTYIKFDASNVTD